MSSAPPVTSPCFIDTNIWLYAFITGSDTSKETTAKEIIRREPNIVLSTQVINEVAVNLIRKVALAGDDLRKLITSFYRRYHVVNFDQTILLHASEIRTRYQISFWDSLIVASALAAKAHIIYSEDMHNGLVIEGQAVITNPFASIS